MGDDFTFLNALDSFDHVETLMTNLRSYDKTFNIFYSSVSDYYSAVMQESKDKSLLWQKY